MLAIDVDGRGFARLFVYHEDDARVVRHNRAQFRGHEIYGVVQIQRRSNGLSNFV